MENSKENMHFNIRAERVKEVRFYILTLLRVIFYLISLHEFGPLVSLSQIFPKMPPFLAFYKMHKIKSVLPLVKNCL